MDIRPEVWMRGAGHVLGLVNARTGDLSECEVVYRRSGDERTMHVVSAQGDQIIASSRVDFEEAFCVLRDQLEERDLLLLCNRYRVDAFVSSMSRQMSDGLSCYIVESGSPVDPSLLVDAMAPAPPHKVVTRAEAAAFIRDWVASLND